MLITLEAINIIAIILMLAMLLIIVRQQPSKAQTAFILYDVGSIVFVVGIHLELIHADTVGEALSGLCVQYVGQAGFLIALLWFIFEFAHIKIPVWLYGIHILIECPVLIGIFTAEHHTYFYTSMRILTDGMYNRIKVTDGILWHLHFMYVYFIVLIIIILCIQQYKKATPIQKKRILFIAIGISVLALELLFKIIGAFGSYNPIVCALTFTMFCMMMAMVKYSYFGSLHAAVDNAFNHGDEGLIVLDAENTIVFINYKIKQLFPKLNVGDSIAKQNEILEVLKSRDSMLQKDEIIYELRIENIIENGEKNGCMLWFIDQTEYLKIMKQLREANEAKTQFLMKISHELRTPMNTMLGMNEMISRETSEAQIQVYAKEVALAGENMLFLIEEVLDASRLESGKLELKKRAYQMKDVLQKAETLMRPQAERKGLSFKVEAEKELTAENTFLYGDDVHILQIITNLLSNAVKYTNEGYVFLKAGTGEREGKKVLCLSVSDTGIGIQAEDQERIFESFERGVNAKKSEKEGMGLGLAIVKQLTEAMEGTLTVKSTPEMGSTFLVTVPWMETTEINCSEEKSAEQTVETGKNIKQMGKEQGDKTENPVIPDFSTKIILAVDDTEQNLMVLKHLLKRTQVRVETAMDGNHAVEACRSKTYDLILLDHMMSPVDGIETLNLIREDKAGRNHYTKVIAVTANAIQGAEEMYLKRGFADYVTKPILPEQLEEILLKHIGVEWKEDLSDADADLNKQQFCESQMYFLEKNGIHAAEGLQYADGDIEFYQSLMNIFVMEKERNEQKLNAVKNSLLSEDREAHWPELVSQFHKFKSEAIGIGAADLGEMFYKLELAGKGKDIQKIEEIYPAVMEEWQKVVEIMKKAVAIV